MRDHYIRKSFTGPFELLENAIGFVVQGDVVVVFMDKSCVMFLLATIFLGLRHL